MFTGIIETIGIVKDLKVNDSNLDIYVQSNITAACKIDQSLAHNGICLTIVDIIDQVYKVTAVDETLQKTNLQFLKLGDEVNLERAMILNERLDGHIVQGHVDDTAKCLSAEDQQGSWLYTFSYNEKPQQIIVEKGSICINGVSLTAFNVTENSFQVAIVPYTYEHTNFHHLQPGQIVNLEFDILGKYMAKLLKFKEA